VLVDADCLEGADRRRWRVQAALAAAALLGFAMAEVGVSVQHDANHGAYSRCGLLPADPLLGLHLGMLLELACPRDTVT
jgi:hypothetical protein